MTNIRAITALATGLWLGVGIGLPVSVGPIGPVLTFAEVLVPPPGEQDCGRDCEPCGFFGKEGQIFFDHHIGWLMDCDAFASDCVGCWPELAADDDWQSPEDIRAMLASAEGEDLFEVVTAVADRIVLDTDRSLLAVRGNACDPEMIHSVMFLDEEASLALATLALTPASELTVPSP